MKVLNFASVLYKHNPEVFNIYNNVEYIQDVRVVQYNTVITARQNIIPSIGKGSIIGNTYLNDTSTKIESIVKLFNNGTFIDETRTVDGYFKFSNISTDLTFDVTATPVSGTYHTIKYNDIVPVDDASLYNMYIATSYNKTVHTGYTFNVFVYDNISSPIYTLSNAPAGVTVNDSGTVSVGNNIGKLNFTVDVTDTVLAVTKSLDISLNVVENPLIT